MKPKNKTPQQLLEALRQQQIINITYQNQQGKETRRQLRVLNLGHQYFTGYCYLREEIRTFKTNRIIQLTITSKRSNNTNFHF